MDIEKNSRNPVILVLGMAGSGKTSFVNMFSLYLKSIDKTSYSINLDPAVLNLPYKPNIDIRDIINYKEVMRKYKLGPNGAIVTSLNLFSTKINEVIKTIEENSCNYTYTIIDTPGQIEVFTWSASGMIISETLAGTWPTFIIYVVDTPRSINPCTFMSNMLNAVSCMYKTRLPLLVVFNKTDLKDSSEIVEWMQNFESMERALEKETTYSSSLANSLCLALEEFYKELKFAKISSSTGEGMSELILLFDDMLSDYRRDFDPFYKGSRNCNSDPPTVNFSMENKNS